MSGKGGVGKSMVTSQLAVSLRRKGLSRRHFGRRHHRPSIPKAFGMHERLSARKMPSLPCVSSTGIEVMSINLLLDDETDPVIWRGPVIGGVVTSSGPTFFGTSTTSLVDMPPGTGDVTLSVFQSIPLSGIVVVASPQELVGMVVEKAVKMAEKMAVPIVGLVENMSYLVCPDCGRKIYLFGEGQERRGREKHGIPLLAQMPIDPQLAALTDEGRIEEFKGDWLADAVTALEAR